MRLANYILTGGQLFRWRHGETGPGEEVKARLWDGVADLLNHGSWDLLEELFPSTGNAQGLQQPGVDGGGSVGE